jgi:hypothetical protein
MAGDRRWELGYQYDAFSFVIEKPELFYIKKAPQLAGMEPSTEHLILGPFRAAHFHPS